MSPTASGIVVAASSVLAACNQIARHRTRSRGRCSRATTSRQPTCGTSGDPGVIDRACSCMRDLRGCRRVLHRVPDPC